MRTQLLLPALMMEEEGQELRMQRPLEAENDTQFTASKETQTTVLGHKELNSANYPNEQEKHSSLELSKKNAAC